MGRAKTRRISGGLLLLLLLCLAVLLKPSSIEAAPSRVKLPEPRYRGGISVEEALRKRRSVRRYRRESASIGEVAQILWAAQGINRPSSGRRTAPSAGARYPLSVYLVAGSVDGLAPGIYRYSPEGHLLDHLKDGDFRNILGKATRSQRWMELAPFTLVLSAVYGRTTSRYGERGVLYVHMEAGHAAQNVCLQAVSLGLGSVVMGAFDDREVRLLLGLKKEAEPLYIIPVGRP